jgi:hypothetical protein
MQKENKTVNMGFTNQRFPVSTHMCLIYNSENERKKVISKYIHSGIIDNEKVVYLADDVTKSEVYSWLMEMGLDVNSKKTINNFEVKEGEKVYCSEGYFSPDKMLDGLKVMHGETMETDVACLRASGEMTWALKGIPGSEKLIEYESRLNDLVQTHPFVALCQYDANKFDGKTIYNVLQVHPFMIVKGQILSNPYYVKPSEFLKNLKCESEKCNGH